MKIHSIQIINDWGQLFRIGKENWYEFHFLSLNGEIDKLAKITEWTAALLGLGVIVRFDRGFAHSELKRMADRAYAELNAKHDTERVFDDEESES